MTPKQPTRALIRRLRKPRMRFPARRRLLRRPIGRGVGRQRVCAQLAIEVDLDGPDVRGADRGAREEAPAPAAEQDDALIECEEARQRALQVRRHAVQLAGEVAPALHDPRHRRVEAVVVAGGKVDDAVVERCGRLCVRGGPPGAGGLAEGEVGAHFGFGGRGGGSRLVGWHFGRYAVLGRGPGEQIREGVGDAVYFGELLVCADDFFVADAVAACAGLGEVGGRADV